MEQEQPQVNKGGRPLGATKHEQWKKNVGEGVSRMTPENLQKLKEAFAIDCTIEQACAYTEISVQTYYNWLAKKPELLEEFSRMRQKLPLKAKANIAQKIHGKPVEGDIGLSKWFLERKEANRYGETINLNINGDETTDVEAEIVKKNRERLEQDLAKSVAQRWRDKEKTEEESEHEDSTQ